MVVDTSRGSLRLCVCGLRMRDLEGGEETYEGG